MKRPLMLAALLSTTMFLTSLPATHADETLTWYDVTTWGVEGRILPDEPRERWFDRFPLAAQETVTKNVWGLSRHSAGMMVRFKTDATAIHVHYELMSSRL